MGRRTSTILACAAIAAGLAGASAVLLAGDRRYASVDTAAAAERVLYLRSGRTADRLMLSFDAIAADVYWIRTIQHYGRDRKSRRTTGRFELLYPMLDLTTSLDPYFNIAYRFGAIFLAQPAPMGPNRVDEAMALLKKGLANDPGHWKYALDIGFLYYWYGTGGSEARADFASAAEWFDRAAAMPDAPPWLRPLAAITRAQGGDRRGARRMLQDLAASEEAWLRRAAERGLQQLQALDELDALQHAVDLYIGAKGHPPSGVVDLQRSGILAGDPRDPSGAPYEYDLANHRFVLSPQSSLVPLPRTLSTQ